MKKHTFLVSDESVNSYGFKVLTNGIDTSQFEKNPIMLYMHERPRIIGKWENLTRKKGKLYADAVFDLEDPFASEIAGKVERGFLKCASIGLGKAVQEQDTVTSCQLYEISIVDIGSNGNALRLYTDTEQTIQLKLNEINVTESLISILGLNESNYLQVVTQVKSLLKLNDDYKKQLDKIKLDQEEEAIILVDGAISRKLIDEKFRNLHLEAFKSDFNKARIELAELFPFKRVSLVDMLNSAKKESKGKENWTLEDYRKFAPKELEKNPELYNSLLKNEYGRL